MKSFKKINKEIHIGMKDLIRKILNKENFYEFRLIKENDIWIVKKGLSNVNKNLESKSFDEHLGQRYLPEIKKRIQDINLYGDVFEEFYDEVTEKYNFWYIKKLSKNEVYIAIINDFNDKVITASLNDKDMAIEMSGIAIWKWLVNENRLICNDNLYKILEVDRLEEGYNSPKDLLKFVDDGYREKLEIKINKLLEGQSIVQGEDYKIHTAKGKTHWVRDLGHHISKNEDGSIDFIIGFYNEIDSRKEFEQKYLRQRNIYQQLFSNSLQAMALIDENQVVININGAFSKIFGFRKEEIVGKSISLIVPEEYKNDFINHIDVINNDGSVKKETFRKTKNGRKIPVLINIFSIHLGENKRGSFLIVEDISVQKEMEKAIKQQKELFEQLFTNSTEAVVLHDNSGKIIRVNKSFTKLFGYSEKETIGKDLDNLVTPNNLKEEGRKFLQEAVSKKSVIAETTRVKKCGELVYVSINSFPVGLPGEETGAYVIYNDITDRKREEERIRYLSFHDELTELYNRRYFENEIERLNKSRELPISIVVGDINNLKEINDTLGHAAGDKYIKLIAKTIKNCIRESDILARVGGDEFALILPHTSEIEAKEACRRIKECLLIESKRVGFDLSMAIGCATKKEDKQDLMKVFNTADYYMYQEKGIGR